MSEPSSPEITSISQVDELIDKGPIPPTILASLTPFEQRLLAISPIYGQLLHMKVIYGAHPAIKQHFAARREQQLHAANGDEMSGFHRTVYEKALQQISLTSDHILHGNRVRKFLDLGCSPGGFSNYLLENNQFACGLGLTLPDEDAKFKFDVSGTQLAGPRYSVIFDNIVNLTMSSIHDDQDLFPGLVETRVAADAPRFVGPYDLVLAGAFPSLESHVPWWYRIQLLISQLFIAIQNLEEGGTCIVLIKTKPFRWVIEVLALLRRSFGEVTASKGSHRVRSSCYLVCRNFCATGERRAEISQTLRSALFKLDAVSKELSARRGSESPVFMEWSNEYVPTEDSYEILQKNGPLLSAESDDELFDEEHRFTLDVLEPQWDEQYRCIYGALQKKLEFLGYSKADSPTGYSPRSPYRPTFSPSSSPVREFSQHASGEIGTQPRSPVWTRRPDPLAIDEANPTSPDQSPLSSPLSPTFPKYVPKWRPPQRRASATTAAPVSDAVKDWRSREASESKPPGNSFNPVFGSVWRRRSTSAANPGDSHSWKRPE